MSGLNHKCGGEKIQHCCCIHCFWTQVILYVVYKHSVHMHLGQTKFFHWIKIFIITNCSVIPFLYRRRDQVTWSRRLYTKLTAARRDRLTMGPGNNSFKQHNLDTAYFRPTSSTFAYIHAIILILHIQTEQMYKLINCNNHYNRPITHHKKLYKKWVRRINLHSYNK